MADRMSILITGAGRGIGRALCAEALGRGYRVHAMVRKLGDAPAGTTPHIADLRDRDAVEKILVTLAPELTHFIANAGIDGRYHPKDPSAVQKVIDVFEVNGTATAFSMVVMAREWVRLGLRGRRMAVVSSLAAGRGMSRSGFYIATKTAGLCLAQAMEADLMPFGIGVSVIRPGFVRTDMTAKNKFKMPFLIDSSAAARMIMDGIEHERFMIAFPWQLRAVCWLRDHIPYFIFRRINHFIASKEKET